MNKKRIHLFCLGCGTVGTHKGNDGLYTIENLGGNGGGRTAYHCRRCKTTWHQLNDKGPNGFDPKPSDRKKGDDRDGAAGGLLSLANQF